jgi:uncharacterized protein DUF6152
VRWVNSHTHFLLDVDEGSGSAVTWVFETAAPNGLRRAGFSQKGVFKVGEQYTFVGYQARDGSTLFLESLTGPDGKTVKIWFGDPNASSIEVAAGCGDPSAACRCVRASRAAVGV